MTSSLIHGRLGRSPSAREVETGVFSGIGVPAVGAAAAAAAVELLGLLLEFCDCPEAPSVATSVRGSKARKDSNSSWGLHVFSSTTQTARCG